MYPILIHTDTDRFNSVVKDKSIHLEDLNEILTDYEALNLPPLTGLEFQQLVRNPADAIFDKMTKGEPLTMGSLPISKQKAMELIVKPAGYNELLEIIESFTSTRHGWNNLLNSVDIVDNKVVLKQSVVDAELEASKIYVRTEKEKQLHDFATKVIAAANAAFGENSPHNLAHLVDQVIYTRKTPAGNLLMPLHKHSFEINHRKIVGFGHPDYATRWHSTNR